MSRPFKFSKWGTIQAMMLSIMEAEMKDASCGGLTHAISTVLKIEKPVKNAQGHLLFRARWRSLVSSMRRLNDHMLRTEGRDGSTPGTVTSAKLDASSVNLRELLKLMDGGTAACGGSAAGADEAVESCVEEWILVRAALCNYIAVTHPDYRNTPWA